MQELEQYIHNMPGYMKKIVFSPSAINDFKHFKSGNQNLVFKIFEIITDIQIEIHSCFGHYAQ